MPDCDQSGNGLLLPVLLPRSLIDVALIFTLDAQAPKALLVTLRLVRLLRLLLRLLLLLMLLESQWLDICTRTCHPPPCLWHMWSVHKAPVLCTGQ